ncbi:MAG: hypothetical protein AAFQ90_10090 [Pseudomonadota bacterium]
MKSALRDVHAAQREIESEGSFAGLVGIAGIVMAFYLVWPVESWIEAGAALFGGFIAGAFLGRFILATSVGRALVRATGALIKLAIVVIVIGALIYFVQNN